VHLATLALAFQLAPAPAPAPAPPRAAVHGYTQATRVAPPRLDATARIDGALDDPVWAQAALLTGFSEYLPVDERPAADSTEVLVWYSPSAIYVGVRAWQAPGLVRATLADRDKIGGEDHVQVILDTYDDRRRAYVFAANALGIQADGIRVEASGTITPQRGFANVDLSADFLYDSRGRRTPTGYEVEMRIPFKSLRYRGSAAQDWGFNVIREVQHRGVQDTWTPTKRGAASFLGQLGRLADLRGIERGLVLDLNPVVTSQVPGAEGPDGRWQYDQRPEVGGNVRWGITPDYTLNATVNPDFSQVESDVAVVPGDLRFPIFFPERRPFFTDGAEAFELPNRLVYTRAIADPNAAARVTGKTGPVDVALLAAVDGRTLSVGQDDHPLFGILRVRRDLGEQSWVGLTYTDRTERATANRVAGIDLRHLWGVNQLNVMAVASRTTGDGAATGELWDVALVRSGRRFGYRYEIKGISPDFETRTGFINRGDYLQYQVNHRVSFLRPARSFVQRVDVRTPINLLGPYHASLRGGSMLETKFNVQADVWLRGGWHFVVHPLWETFDYLPSQYEGYFVARAADTVAWAPLDRQSSGGFLLNANSPQWRTFVFRLNAYLGTDPDFFETTVAYRRILGGSFEWRPTRQVRVEGRYASNRFKRRRDESVVVETRIPRLKVEYQATRAIFVRLVSEYQASFRDALRDPRTDQPLLRATASGYAPVAESRSNRLRTDLLFSFQPNPGTVFFAGYGQTGVEPDALRFTGLERRADGFFLKASYLFRVP
jgi:hypothetical protein